MSDTEKETKSLGTDLNNVEGSTGAAEVYIDPVKEAKMMRKFDVREFGRALWKLLTLTTDLLHRHDGSILFDGKLGSVWLAEICFMDFADLDCLGAT
jgi:hypothetical protein